MAGMIILHSAYGIEVQPEDDPYVQMSERALHAMAEAGNAGAYLVDSLPWLKHVPDWFPGAGFKKEAQEWRKSVAPMPFATLNFVKRSMVSTVYADNYVLLTLKQADGTAKSSIASRNLQEMEDEKSWTTEKEEVLTNVLSSMYAGGEQQVFLCI